MKKSVIKFFTFCGLLLMLAAFPVFAQEIQENKINNKPFQDFATVALQEISTKKINLSDSFLIELNGDLTEDGKLDSQKSAYIKSEGNVELVKISKGFFEAISDSGWFKYFRTLGINKINLILAQDKNQVYGQIISETETVNKAGTIAVGLNMMVRMVQTKKGEMKGMSENERVLINGLKVNTEGKTLTMSFAYEKSVIQNMVNLKLRESVQK